MKRVITALVVLPFLIASILISWLWWLFVALAGAAIVLGLWEFYLLSQRPTAKPDAAAGYLASTVLFVVALQNDLTLNLLVTQLVFIALTIGCLISQMVRGANFDKMVASTGATILGVLYVAFLGSHLVALRTNFAPSLSADLLSFFFLVLMGSDIGAYYIGRAFGKTKLAPKISPGKTWEGVAGGVATALGMATLAHFWFFPELSLPAALALAALMNVLGVVGDLTESALKRGANAKDAAQILPGHGGLFDRLDSLLFNAPLLYYFALYYWR